MASFPTVLRYDTTNQSRHEARAALASERKAVIEAWCNACGVSMQMRDNGDYLFFLRPHAKAQWRIWTALFSCTPDKDNVPERVEKCYDYVQLLFKLESWLKEARL